MKMPEMIWQVLMKFCGVQFRALKYLKKAARLFQSCFRKKEEEMI
jgi:hypothetical protein